METKTINLKKFPLLNRDGEVEEADIAKVFLNVSYNNAQSRDDVVKNLSLKEDDDIELTEENIEFFMRYLPMLQPATVLYSFEKYLEQ